VQRLGFIHDMMDVKVLILYVTARADYPMNCQEVYEVCYQDECLSYFDVCTAIPEMVETGHLNALPEGKYEITQKGIEAGSLTEDSIVFTVKQSAEHAVERFNRKVRRSSFIKTQIAPRAGGDYSVVVTLDDDKGNLMTLELMAPDQPQAIRLSRLMEEKAENVYNLVMMELLDDSFTED
jgi:hypothetical protein